MTMSTNTMIMEAGMGRSGAAAAGGIAAVVLAIIGLANVNPAFMASVATIALGIALLFKGAAIATEYRDVLSKLDSGTLQQAELGGGMSAELLAGGAGIALGILALLGIQTSILTPIAAIVFGVALLMSAGVTNRMNHLKIKSSGAEDMAQRIAEEATTVAVDAEMLVAIGAVVLGILSLVGLIPMTLTLVAMLAIGGASILVGSAVGSKMAHMFRR